MAMKDKFDMATGAKLRRLTLEQAETAEQVFEALSAERASEATQGDSTPDVVDEHKHRGPVRLASPFEGLSL